MKLYIQNNRDTTDNFIKHHSLNNRNKNYFEPKDSKLTSFKLNNQNEIKSPEFIREFENQSE